MARSLRVPGEKLGTHLLPGDALTSRIFAINCGSLMISSVSSRLSRSSGLISTAAGLPWRVTTTRSCRVATRSTISEKRALTSAREKVFDMTRILV